MPNDVFHELRKVRVCGRQLRPTKMEERAKPSYGTGRKPKPKSDFRSEPSYFTGHKKKRK